MQRASLQSQAVTYARTQWVLGCALLLILAGLYLFAYRPAAARVAVLRQDTHARRQQFEADELRARDLKVVELQVERLRARLERFDKRLPSQRELGQEVGTFIRDITQLSRQGSMKKITVQPGVLKRSEMFAELPISLNFEGDFVSAFTFLQQTELMPRLTRVRKLAMKTKDSKLGQVEVQVSMNLYFADN